MSLSGHNLPPPRKRRSGKNGFDEDEPRSVFSQPRKREDQYRRNHKFEIYQKEHANDLDNRIKYKIPPVEGEDEEPIVLLGPKVTRSDIDKMKRTVRVEVAYNGTVYREHHLAINRRLNIPFGTALIQNSSTDWPVPKPAEPEWGPTADAEMADGVSASASSSIPTSTEPVATDSAVATAIPDQETNSDSTCSSENSFKAEESAAMDCVTIALDLPGGHQYYIKLDGIQLREGLQREEKQRAFEHVTRLTAELEQEPWNSPSKRTYNDEDSDNSDEIEEELERAKNELLTGLMKQEEASSIEMQIKLENGIPDPAFDMAPDYHSKPEQPELPVDPDAFMWVACDKCHKWRKLFGQKEEELPEKWFCDMNPNSARASCSAPEDKDEEQKPSKSKKNSSNSNSNSTTAAAAAAAAAAG
eukprot:CAMPEP_0175138560 /NCGR_PEP_ID=MMETSP0087-20121206/10420_1 /TAXON_ID=136419 /ORGANISM="Unknown Unknown, Strain D1" /LENGTH=415 /DNA_ID=CAMNT_0016421483 /DNA_START=152 /DNA_END=1396 /DNA_ORIENTATION=-